MTQEPRRASRHHREEPAKKGDFAAFLEHMKENPLLYAAFLGIVIVAAAAGVVYRIHTAQETQKLMTEYTRAVRADDAETRSAELAALTDREGEIRDEVIYMAGEAELRVGNYTKARELFEQLRSDFPDSTYVPAAVEGAGFIHENQGEHAKALERYREVLDKWPDTFAGKRQHLNVARCEEELGNLDAAVAAYQDQANAFPGSTIEAEARTALARLEASHPDLFPEEPAPVPQATPEEVLDSVLLDLQEEDSPETDGTPEEEEAASAS
jgi:tetratricopeptide (TPR) repeat protein